MLYYNLPSAVESGYADQGSKVGGEVDGYVGLRQRRDALGAAGAAV